MFKVTDLSESGREIYDVERGIHINVFMQWFEEIK